MYTHTQQIPFDCSTNCSRNCCLHLLLQELLVLRSAGPSRSPLLPGGQQLSGCLGSKSIQAGPNEEQHQETKQVRITPYLMHC